MRAKDFDRDKFFLEDWPNALESGEYEQGKGSLYTNYPDRAVEKYCCLGVACQLLADMNLLPKKNWRDAGFLPDRAVKLLGIRDSASYNEGNNALYEDNDNGVKFKKIAKMIRSLYKSGKFDPPFVT